MPLSFQEEITTPNGREPSPGYGEGSCLYATEHPILKPARRRVFCAGASIWGPRMRTRIIGHVGEPVFSDALRALKASSKRRTLIVAGGRGEAILHFEGGSVRALVSGEWASLIRDPSAPAGGGDPGGPPRKTGPLLAEIARSADSVFELREGALPASVASDPDLVSLPESVAEVVGCLANSAAPEAEAPRERPTVFSRIASLSGALAGARAKHTILRELGELWLRQGSPSWASQCFREAAQSCLEWEETERAFELFFRAVEICPLDLAAAEDAIALAVKCGRAEEAEVLAERVFLQLEAAKRYEPMAALYHLFGRRPRSSVLRRLGGEGLVRVGQTAEGVKELLAAARSLESEGDLKAATRVYERVLAVEAGSEEAQSRLGRIRNLQAIKREAVRWGTLLAAVLAVAGWVFWDASAASALSAIPSLRDGVDPHAVLEEIQKQRGRYPLTRQEERLRRLEASLYDFVYPKERDALARAIELRKTWNLDGAKRELEALEHRGIVPCFRERAASLAAEIREFESRANERLQAASAAMKCGRFEEAFSICREILDGVKRETFASGWFVPAYIESAPEGAEVIVERESRGRTPTWVMLPAAKDTPLRVGAPGYEPAHFVDPLGKLIQENSHRLKAVLELPSVWSSCAGGGLAAERAFGSESVIPVLGGDGVIRGFDVKLGRWIWQRPLEVGEVLKPPILAGPAVLVPLAGGRIVCLRVADGSLAWAKSFAPQGIDVRIGPAYGGQLLVLAGRRARLVNPLTGLVVREVELAEAEPYGNAAVVGDLGLFPLGAGGVAGASLRTGKLEFVRWRELGCPQRIASAGSEAALLYRGGRIRVVAPSKERFLWDAELGAAWTHLAASSGQVWVGSEDGKIVSFDSRTGSPLWRQELGASIKVLFADERASKFLLVQAVRSGRLVALALAARTGSVRWEKDVGPEELASVGLAGDLVFVTAPSRGILAVRIPGW